MPVFLHEINCIDNSDRFNLQKKKKRKEEDGNTKKKSWNFNSNKRLHALIETVEKTNLWSTRQPEIVFTCLVSMVKVDESISREEFRIFLLLHRSRMTFSIDSLHTTRLCNSRGLPHAQIVLILFFFLRFSFIAHCAWKENERKKKTKEKRILGRLISISQQKCRVIARNSRLNL